MYINFCIFHFYFIMSMFASVCTYTGKALEGLAVESFVIKDKKWSIVFYVT